MDNRFYCLNGTTGQQIWNYTIAGRVNTSPCVADLFGNGRLEVIVGCGTSVYCLNGATGHQVWNYTTSGYVGSSPCVADLFGNGRLEVIVGSLDKSVYCLNGTVGAPWSAGAYAWPSIGFRGDVRHSGNYVDSDHDGLTDGYEVTAGTNPHNPDTDTDGLTDYQEFLASTNPLHDQVPPAAITNLAAGSPTDNSVTLSWTAPGDNGNQRNATGYWVKYSTSGPINASNWAAATNYTQTWTPAKNGTSETRVISNLTPGTRYWFAVEAYDKATPPNYGEVSNTASATTTNMVATVLIIVGVAGAIIVVVAVALYLRKRGKGVS